MKKIFFLFACLQCVVIFSCFAQKRNTVKIDSLKKKIAAATEDTGKVRCMLGLIAETINGHPDSALAKSIEALHLSQKVSWPFGKALSLHFIGTAYGMMGNADLCIENLNSAITIWDSLEKVTPADKLPAIVNFKARSYGNLGMIFWRRKENKKALQYDFIAVDLDHKSGYTKSLALHLGNIGRVYESSKIYDSATLYELKAMELYKATADTNGIATVMGYLGNLSIAKKDYVAAENYLLQAIDFSYATGDFYNVMEQNEQLSDLYILTKQFEKSLNFYKRAMSVKDTLFKKEQENEISQKEMAYQYREKEMAAKLEREKQQAGERYFRYAIMCVLLASLIISVLMYKQRNRIRTEKKKSDSLLDEVQVKSKEITDNINYAQRIQNAILPEIKQIYKTLDQSFILFQPKDIVSGDFYGFAEREDKIVVIAADCTGHGVSGAFMSMIGSSLLKQIINERNITEPAEILRQLNVMIIEALNQNENETNDGMDVSICVFDRDMSVLQYAGANRPLWIVRQGNLMVFGPDKHPIGGLQVAKNRKFNNHVIGLEKGDSVYIFTDGFADQFGGDNGKKLMTGKFKEMILSIQNKSIREQESYLKSYFEKWKGINEQVDDVLVIGVRV